MEPTNMLLSIRLIWDIWTAQLPCLRCWQKSKIPTKLRTEQTHQEVFMIFASNVSCAFEDPSAVAAAPHERLIRRLAANRSEWSEEAVGASLHP